MDAPRSGTEHQIPLKRSSIPTNHMCCKAVLVQDARPPPPSPTVKSGEARLCTVDFLEQTVAAAGFAARVTKDRIPLKALKLSTTSH